jgi:hypothetical protein
MGSHLHCELVHRSEDDGIEFDPALDTWPRTTQLFMLNEKADLVGGLMDFDVIIASCAYDGITVHATPRAAFSLKTVVQVATPFVFEERRDRPRITKVSRVNRRMIVHSYFSVVLLLIYGLVLDSTKERI